MKKLGLENTVAMVFGLGGLLVSFGAGLIINAMSLALTIGVPSSLVAFAWARYLIKKFDFENLAKVDKLERRGVGFGLSVVGLTVLSASLVLTFISIFGSAFSAIEVPIMIFGWLVMLSVFSFGLPYLLGIVLGIWAARFKFDTIHQRNQKNN
ncbi:hypothetical protein KFE80_04215 [bacterium SCSIO 12696]|nr:hypothetical protein KFE80_04215 [bacterium SCSIO 12696]